MASRALVFGRNGGIAGALAEQLDRAGTDTVVIGRSDGLQLRDSISVAQLAQRTPGPFDLIFDATGALSIDGAEPEKTIAGIEVDAMLAQFAVNAVGPALLLKHFHGHLPRTGRGVFATLSARVGSIGDNRLGGWISYRASKAALNQIVRTAAIEIARRRPDAIVAALHPGTVATALSSKYLGRHPAVSPEASAANLLAVIEGLTPAESGGFFAWDGSPIPW